MNSHMTENPNLKYYEIDKIENAHILGRYNKITNPMPLFFQGSGVEVNVTGTELWIEVEADFDLHEPWACVYVNGALVSRFNLMPGTHRICLLRTTTFETIKNVQFIRELQAMSEDDGNHILVKGLWTDGAFEPVPPKPLKLELIGDSITSGEGTYGAVGDLDWIAMYMSISHNYASMTARALNAEAHYLSQGGWGVYCGWDNNRRHNIPSVYEQVCGLCKGAFNEKLGADKPYDFASWQPDAIIVNLGTNDTSAFNEAPFVDPETGEVWKQRTNEDGTLNEEDVEQVKKSVIDFLKTLRKHNPKAHIVWVYGMLGYTLTLVIADAINTYTRETGDKNVNLLTPPETTEDTVGSRMHPGLPVHEKASEMLVNYLKTKLL